MEPADVSAGHPDRGRYSARRKTQAVIRLLEPISQMGVHGNWLPGDRSIRSTRGTVLEKGDRLLVLAPAAAVEDLPDRVCRLRAGSG